MLYNLLKEDYAAVRLPLWTKDTIYVCIERRARRFGVV